MNKFNILRTFVFNRTKHPITILQNEAGKPIFRADEIGTILGLKNVRTSIRDFDEKQKGVRRLYTINGPQQITVLTQRGVYRLLYKSSKPIAATFVHWIDDILDSIQETGGYHVKQDLNTEECIKFLRGTLTQKELEDAILVNREQHMREETHAQLVHMYHLQRLVYVVFIKHLDIEDKDIIKIGSTADIKGRSSRLRQMHGNCLAIRVFACNQHEKFEKFLHQNARITPFSYREEIHEGSKSSETYLVDTKQLKMILTLMECSVKNYIRDSLDEMKESMSEMQKMIQRLMEDSLNNKDKEGEDTIVIQEQEPDLVASSPPVSEQDTQILLPRRESDDRLEFFLRKSFTHIQCPKTNIFQLICIVALVTGLKLPQIFTGKLEEIDQFTATYSGNAYWHKNDYKISLLMPIVLVNAALQRIQAEKSCSGLNNAQINQKYCNSVSKAVKKFTEQKEITLQDLINWHRDHFSDSRTLIRKRKHEELVQPYDK